MRIIAMYNLSLLMLSSSLLTSLCLAGAQPVAKVTAVVRVVRHQPGGKGAWLRTKIGTQLRAGDRVRTGRRSYAELRFADKSIHKLGERTDFVVLSPVPGATDARINVGSLWAKFAKGTRATIRTRTTVAAVRGTEIYVRVFEDGREEWHCFEGALRLVTPTRSMDLSAGQQTDVDPTGDIGEPTDAPPSQYAGGEETPMHERFSSGEDTGVTNDTTDFEQERSEEDPAQPQLNPVTSPSGEAFATFASEEQVDDARESGEVPDQPTLGPPGPIIPQGNMQVVIRGQTRQVTFFPRAESTAFVFTRDGHWLSGARIRQKLISGEGMLIVGAMPVSLFEETSRVRVTDFCLLAKRGNTALRIGRHWLVRTPVVGTSVGTLMPSQVVDGITWTQRWGLIQTDIAYLTDARPFAPGKQSAWYGRISGGIWGGRLGLSYLHLHNRSTGGALDWAFPMVRDEVDFYGEVGYDPLFRDRYITIGTYFPGFYQRTGIDVFFEYSRRPRPYHSIWAVRFYAPIGEHLRGALIFDYTPERRDFNIGVGIGYVL